MSFRLGSLLLVFFFILCCIGIAASADQSPESAAAQISVTNISLDPGVFMTGDKGTVAIEVTNSGTQSVPIHRATMYDQDIQVISAPYESVGSIGAGNRMKFTFPVQAQDQTGLFYPIFSIDFRDAGSLRYPVQFQVEDIPLSIAVLEKPDTFSAGKKDTIRISIGNPRDNQVNGVIVTPSGPDLEITPTSYFIGSLDQDRSFEIPFSLTPGSATNFTITVNYKNGMNVHTTSLALPIPLLESKRQANPVLSNVQSVYENGIYHVTGDVTNTGLEDAKSVIIATGGDSIPVDPYRSYPVGSLKPDDFSSFEVTFTAENITQVPLIVSYKDTDGNTFTGTGYAEISTHSSASSGESPNLIITGAVIVMIAVMVAAAVLYSWRKRR